ncbi:unnamed protein product, partial [marine sediment metagenome]
VDICKQLGGDVYLSGKDGASYMNFSDNAINMRNYLSFVRQL